MNVPATTDRYRDAEKLVFDEGWYENAELRHLPALLAGVKVFVDVGASIGPYTRCAAREIKGGRIIAIEANPETYRRLQNFVRQWAEETGNRIDTLHAAAGERAGKIDLFIPSESSPELPLTSSTVNSEVVAADWQTTPVDCLTLDSILADLEPDLIKIDVEGAEYRVLQGAEGILNAGRCRFLVEIHPWGDPAIGKKPADIFNFFYDHGYDFRRVARHWHFAKTPLTWKHAVKRWAINLIMSNQALKKPLRNLVLALDRLRLR